MLDRKFFVVRLVRCAHCRLMFRIPTTTTKAFERFYQSTYQEGFTTELPEPEKLAQLKASNFLNSGKDYSTYLKALASLDCKPGMSLLDFGASWGYGSWQFSRAGYEVRAFELSIPRREYAQEHLGVKFIGDLANCKKKFDIVFSSHVLEHVTDLSRLTTQLRDLLLPRGLFVAFTPNGSLDYRQTNPSGWHKQWGFVHPLMLDAEFYSDFFSDASFCVDSSPYDFSAIGEWSKERNQSIVLELAGSELMVAVRV